MERTYLLVVAPDPVLRDEWLKTHAKLFQAAEGEAGSHTPGLYVARPLGRGVRPKRSTASGNAQERILAALGVHHQYDKAQASVGNHEAVGVRELARLFIDESGNKLVSDGSVSHFFKDNFGSHAGYVCACREREIGKKLKSIADDYANMRTYGRNPPNEQYPDENDDE